MFNSSLDFFRSNPNTPSITLNSGCYTCTPATCGNCGAGFYYGTTGAVACLPCSDPNALTCDAVTGISLTWSVVT